MPFRIVEEKPKEEAFDKTKEMESLYNEMVKAYKHEKEYDEEERDEEDQVLYLVSEEEFIQKFIAHIKNELSYLDVDEIEDIMNE